MDTATEIRKLPYSNVKELAQILELNDSWKNLMAIIPKKLEKNNYECNTSVTNPCKYRSEHFRLLENASITMQKMCTELLFGEWGTSAKIRPALGHLLYLLTKAQLYRAADYVAETLLKREPPPRPSEGPAAVVTFNINDIKMQEIERNLDQQAYHSSIVSNLSNDSQGIDVNLNYSTRESSKVRGVPKIVISEPEPNRNDSSIAMPLVLETRRQRMHRQDASVAEDTVTSGSINTVSDMIKFSKSEIASDSNNESSNGSSFKPDISAIISSESDNQNSGNCLPDLSALNLRSDSPAVEIEHNQSAVTQSSSEYTPSLSDLLKSEYSSANLPDLDQLNSVHSSGNVPNLSELIPQMNSSSSMSNVETENKEPPVTINVMQAEDSGSLPEFGALLSNKVSFASSDLKNFLPITDRMSNVPSDTSSFGSSKNSNASSDMSQNSNLSQRSGMCRPKCVSPLPNLCLNTPLPHFSYCEVESATNYFDETPHKNCRQVENPLAKTNGRFLGSGAFGSVFLGLDIADRPVAVKKLILNNMDVVDIDDPVTKQFKNEVEVLSKYQHENLLSLIGYSCDGSTYCLLYEFMPGGALKDRLQNTDEKLIWTDRLYIALGTARAVSYLHTAYSTPLIHRDIKTANILLDCTNKPKLCDFGLIKLIPNQNSSSISSAFGTSAYMAREAFRGDVSVKLDTYSFGVVLLELITGLPPLDENREGCDIVTHVEEVCEDDSIVPLIDLKAGSWVAQDVNFAEELYKISIRCLEQNKKKRPTMVEIKEELAELIKRCA